MTLGPDPLAPPPLSPQAPSAPVQAPAPPPAAMPGDLAAIGPLAARLVAPPSQLAGGGLKDPAAVPGSGQVVTPHSQLWWALWRIEIIASVLVLFSSQILAWVHPFGNSTAEFVVSQALSGLALVGLVLSQIINPSPPNARQ